MFSCLFALGFWPRFVFFISWADSVLYIMENRSENDSTRLTEEINAILERLKFSEEETGQIISANDGISDQGFESWAVGELMAIDWRDHDGGWTEFMRIKVKINVLKPLRRLVRMIDKGGEELIGFIKYERLPNFCYGWLRAPVANPNQERGLRRNGVEMVVLGVRESERTNESSSRGDGEQDGNKGKGKTSVVEPTAFSPREGNGQNISREGLGRLKNKRKRHRGPYGDSSAESPARVVPAYPFHMQNGGLPRSGLRRKEWGVGITLAGWLENEDVLRFTGFYGQTASRSRQQASDILRRVHHKVNEGWIVGGDFNAILNLSEKEGGRSKPKVFIEEFCNILEELKLTDIKPCNGWFTWTNNREGDRLVKERLDRFVASDVILDKFPFLASYVVRQSRSDHEAILIDTKGSKPNRERTGHKAWFRYDTCWAGEQELKDLISCIWEKEESNMLAKMDMTRDKLGP
ncbi:hypothetical protein GOBAR_AA19006 [Gossypium barbadense]|uniref:Endonuclease/exonuclease/phosphatase domain-containing protein n=1 Tax=Gossypium barbadense TaxID=3634 RepID=A0A2P5XEA4_GOSBA|nr:hypothetical protein GOBAR_AA19006 [Gossypium barbadense]